MYIIDRQWTYIMDLQEFHALVATSLKRGTSLDAIIPVYSKLAALWMERNYNFQYMENFRLLQLIKGDRTVNLPTNRIVKGIAFIRLIGAEGGYLELKRVSPQDIKGTKTETPSAYWLSGISTIIFNNTPDEDISGEAVFNEYTDWPVVPTGKHPLLDIGTDVILYQTLIHMAAYLRDAEMVQAYKALRDESINTLLRADDETRHQGETLAMAYIPPHTK